MACEKSQVAKRSSTVTKTRKNARLMKQGRETRYDDRTAHFISNPSGRRSVFS